MRLIWTGGRPCVRAYTGATGPRLGIKKRIETVIPRSGRPRAKGIEYSPSAALEGAPNQFGIRSRLLGFESALHTPMPAPQQSAITATHERQTSLNQANSAIAKIMGLPALLRNSAGPKQPLRYRAVAVSFMVSIKRPYRERKPLAPSKRQAGMRRKCPLRNA